jgi:hypothetical protein
MATASVALPTPAAARCRRAVASHGSSGSPEGGRARVEGAGRSRRARPQAAPLRAPIPTDRRQEDLPPPCAIAPSATTRPGRNARLPSRSSSLSPLSRRWRTARFGCARHCRRALRADAADQCVAAGARAARRVRPRAPRRPVHPASSRDARPAQPCSLSRGLDRGLLAPENRLATASTPVPGGGGSAMTRAEHTETGRIEPACWFRWLLEELQICSLRRSSARPSRCHINASRRHCRI